MTPSPHPDGVSVSGEEGREALANTIEKVLFDRALQGRLDGYTRQTSYEVADAILGVEPSRALPEGVSTAADEVRAQTLDDVAAIIRNAYKHGAKAETEQEWLQMSWTFSNEAVRIREALSRLPQDGSTPHPPPTLPDLEGVKEEDLLAAIVAYETARVADGSLGDNLPAMRRARAALQALEANNV